MKAGAASGHAVCLMIKPNLRVKRETISFQERDHSFRYDHFTAVHLVISFLGKGK
jgi:hypothetical protein